MSSTQSLVSVKGLHRRYGTLEAVCGVSFELRRGEVLGLLGPNGAGKTTTMQMLCGVLAPTAGEILIDGEDHISAATRTKRKIGYLPEHPPLYRELSVDEYLRFCARLRRVARSDVGMAVERAKSRCGLNDVGERLIGNLSKGFQQRVGIAQAIIHDPPVVILDEPTVGLDPIQIREIRQLIRDLGSERSVILSTHILSEVQATCDRVQIIRAGELIYNASIESLTHNQDISVAVALRSPPGLDELLAIDGVDHADMLSEGKFRIYFLPETSPETLVQTSVEQGWGLYELIPEQQSLEDLFIELTHDEGKDSK